MARKDLPCHEFCHIADENESVLTWSIKRDHDHLLNPCPDKPEFPENIAQIDLIVVQKRELVTQMIEGGLDIGPPATPTR